VAVAAAVLPGAAEDGEERASRPEYGTLLREAPNDVAADEAANRKPLDTEPLRIGESFMIVRVQKPVKEYLRDLMRYGFSHHCIAAPGRAARHLECLARQLDLEVCRL